MTEFYRDEWLTILQGDVRDVLPELASESVDCIVTSPPYWGLRDYGTASWSGGDEACPHEPSQEWIDHNFNANSTIGGNRNSNQSAAATTKWYRSDGTCRCGATRSDGQIGLERTPEEYVANMVGVFRELRRVLKASGTCWLNLGDSYTRAQTGNVPQTKWKAVEFPEHSKAGSSDGAVGRSERPGSRAGGLKDKDLVGIPWRVAFALQADGWYLRSDIIWSKPNPMPESVTDRPTKSHEYLFLLTKSARYYFDADAVREQEKPWNAGLVRAPKFGAERINGAGKAGTTEKQYDTIKGANLRSVWTIATRPYPGAHFAVFPPELPERCIKAGSSERGVCPECGAPWEWTTEKSRTFESGSGKAGNLPVGKNGANLQGGGETGDIRRGPVLHVETTGWQSTCRCANFFHYSDPIPKPPVPAVVLDPFAGSGTTGMVANRLSRRAVLIDLNASYLVQQMKRNAQVPLGLGA